MLGIGNLAKRVFGTQNDRLLKTKANLVLQVAELEEAIKKLRDNDLREKTVEFNR